MADLPNSTDELGVDNAVDPGAVPDEPRVPDAAGPEAVPDEPSSDTRSSSVEELVSALEATTHERDEYLDALRRNQADFENYRKRMAKQQADSTDRAASDLVEKLLPVLDACDGAVRHGAVEVEPIFAALLGTLEKEGLVRLDPAGEVFDPNLHDAVMHEPAEDSDEGTVVADVMRPGYTWKGRVVRAAMVKVRG